MTAAAFGQRPAEIPDHPALRVLHVSSTYPPTVIGGAEKVVAQLAEAQYAAGITAAVTYLVRGKSPVGRRKGVQTYPQANRNLIWMEDVLQRPRLMRTANKLLQMINIDTADDIALTMAVFRPDIVHTHSMVELPPQIWERAQAAGAHVVHTLHDYDLVCSRATMFRNGRQCAERHLACRLTGEWKRRFTRHIDAVVAVSAPVMAVHREYGLFDHIPARLSRVIRNAVPGGGEGPVARPPRTGPFTFGFLGRLVPEKGLGVLLEACRQLPEGGWRLQVAGRSPDGIERWQALAAGLPVDFVGFVEPAPFLDGLDVLIVPSTWAEPFGLTIVEAFARGVAVFGADHGAVAELVGAVDRDWLTGPGDPAALATRMHRAITDGRDRLPGPAAFRDVLRTVRPATMLDDYSQVYAALGRRRAIAA